MQNIWNPDITVRSFEAKSRRSVTFAFQSRDKHENGFSCLVDNNIMCLKVLLF